MSVLSRPAFAPRSLLFVPGSRPDMVAKLHRWRPDAAVVDLEDAVPSAGKDSARETGLAAAGALDLPGTAVLVRINPADSPWFADDLRAVARADVDGVVLPKYSAPATLVEVRSALPPATLIVAGMETARGVASCRDLLARGVDAAYFGAEDYIADLGGYRTEAGLEVLYARSEVVLACRLTGIGAIDQAVTAIRDDARFTADAQAGRALGYTGKICVHPGQVALAHQVFTPSPAEVEHARAVLRLAAEHGVGTVDGQMVDDVHVRMARQVLSRAGEPPPAGPQPGSKRWPAARWTTGAGPMRAGLMMPPGAPASHVTALARDAEELGFDFLACGEHVFFHGPTANAFIALAAAAGATERIRLLSALTILPVYPPALAAKMIATLDGVSGGRFELGVGVGGEFPAEFEACGIPVAERGRRTDEALTVLARLFTGEPVHFAGRYTTLAGQRLQPVPVQRPRPPIWVGGRREASMIRAGRYGDGWLPYLITPERLASGLATAREAAQRHGRAAGDVRGGVYCWLTVDADGNWARRTVADTVSTIYQQDLRPKAGQLLVGGTPAEVAARLARIRLRRGRLDPVRPGLRRRRPAPGHRHLRRGGAPAAAGRASGTERPCLSWVRSSWPTAARSRCGSSAPPGTPAWPAWRCTPSPTPAPGTCGWPTSRARWAGLRPPRPTCRWTRSWPPPGKAGPTPCTRGTGSWPRTPASRRPCVDAGLTWIGPPPHAIRDLGDKVTARRIALRAGAPLVPGTEATVSGAEDIAGFAAEHGLPVAIKAAFGGGGRGFRVATTMAEIPDQYESARREALAAFGRGECYAERYLDRPRHVEAQILADQHGTVVVVGTRDCTLQRRHQKLVEEAPAPFLTPQQRTLLHESARAICREAGYAGAGTVEYLLGRDGTISFLEVNTRLQVEHPVTEETTGIDLVRETFRIAAGQPLRITGGSRSARPRVRIPDQRGRPGPGLPAGPGPDHPADAARRPGGAGQLRGRGRR